MIETTPADVLAVLREHIEADANAHAAISVDLLETRSLLTGNGGVGVMETLRDHDRWIEGQRRLMWLLCPAVLLGAGGLLFQAVVFFLRVPGA